MRVSGCVYIYSLYMCACVQECLCAGNVCLRCQQREYTAKNKNSSVSIQRVCVCVCVCAAIFCACIYVSLCYSVFGAVLETGKFAVNGDKRHRGGVRKGGAECFM